MTAGEHAPGPEPDQAEQAEAAPVENGQGAPDAEKPEYFSDNFDPSQLPEELVPAYKQMQGAWTQKTQALAEQRKEYEQAQALVHALQNPDTQADALAALGFEPVDDDEPEPDPDPTEQMRSEWEQFKAAQAEQEQLQYLEATEQQIYSQITERTSHLGEVPQTVKDAIFDHAIALSLTDDGEVDVAQAVKDFEDEVFGWAQKRYVESKRDAPQPPASSPGAPKFDATDPKARVDRMTSILRQE